MATFRKTAPFAEAAQWEAAGLGWLASFDRVPVVGVVAFEGLHLDLDQLTSDRATPESAETFGRQLAALHRESAAGFGSPPEGWEGDGWLGPNEDLLPLALRSRDSWAEHWVEDCLRPTAKVCVDLGRADESLLARVDDLGRMIDRFETGDPASPVHGDLWSGNVLWTPDGATLIDPSAHGGHRELDLALLQLFGLPQLERVLTAYQEEYPLADGWRERVPVHQLHHLLVHVACFGGGYLASTMEAFAAATG